MYFIVNCVKNPRIFAHIFISVDDQVHTKKLFLSRHLNQQRQSMDAALGSRRSLSDHERLASNNVIWKAFTLSDTRHSVGGQMRCTRRTAAGGADIRAVRHNGIGLREQNQQQTE